MIKLTLPGNTRVGISFVYPEPANAISIDSEHASLRIRDKAETLESFLSRAKDHWYFVVKGPRRQVRAYVYQLTVNGKPDPDWTPLGAGTSYCSYRDTFKREQGRKVALAEALKETGFTREQRKLVWKAYHGRITQVLREDPREVSDGRREA